MVGIMPKGEDAVVAAGLSMVGSVSFPGYVVVVDFEVIVVAFDEEETIVLSGIDFPVKTIPSSEEVRCFRRFSRSPSSRFCVSLKERRRAGRVARKTDEVARIWLKRA